MADKLQFDLTAAHKFFAADNFNKTWEYIERQHRSQEDDLNMLHAAIASLWHWSQRGDATNQNLSVGYWQVSRVLSLVGQPDLARTYGLLSLKHAEALEPFYKGYAYESLARAEMQSGNRVVMRHYLEKAFEMLSLITDEEDKQLLLKDLETIR
ncbi:MAG: hypothetical protein L0287_32185 [Anaerolineae bacterium]|nr:hypothetical protein [Anaerolineae bacterium]